MDYLLTARSNNFIDISSYPFPKPSDGSSVTKAGRSYNIPPTITSTRSKEGIIIDPNRVGRQMGAYDPYRDDNWKDWTYGVQYYTPFVGCNIKQFIPPIIVPRAYDMDRHSNIHDITDLDPYVECGRCSIPSASLGVILPRNERNCKAVLPVNPPTGKYTTQELGWNGWVYPQRVHAPYEMMRRKAGLKPTPILPDFDEHTREWAQSGFLIQ